MRDSCGKPHQGFLLHLEGAFMVRVFIFSLCLSYVVGIPVPSLVLGWSWPCPAELASWLDLGPAPSLRACLAVRGTVADPGECYQTCPALLVSWETAAKTVRSLPLLVLSSPRSFWLTFPSCCSQLPLNIHQREIRRTGREELQTSQLCFDNGTNYRVLILYSSRGQ